MSVKRWRNDRPQFFTATGAVANGYKLFFYEAGSSTKLNTFTDQDGLTANANPLELDSSGRPQTEIWLTAGELYKILYAPPGTDDPPNSTIWSEDNVSGINDPDQSTFPEWIESGLTATFLSATSFSVSGDQTSVFSLQRKLKAIVTGGVSYPTVISASYANPITTVTVDNNGGVPLDSGLNSAIVYYSLLDPTNTSVSTDATHVKATAIATAATTNIWATGGDYAHLTGTNAVTSFGSAPKAGAERMVIADADFILTNGANLVCPGGANVLVRSGDIFKVRADTVAKAYVHSYTRASGIALIPSAHRGYIDGLLINDNSVIQKTVSAGQATDSTGTYLITLSSALVKTQSSWAAGTAAGGKLSAAALTNDTAYFWFLLFNPATGVIDAGFDVSATPTLPSGFTAYRYIGARKTNFSSTDWDSFVQDGDEVRWSTPPGIDFNTGGNVGSRVLTRVNVPIGARVKWIGNIGCNVSGATSLFVKLTDPSCADVAPGNLISPLAEYAFSTNNASSFQSYESVTCWTNTDARIGVRVSNAGVNLFMQTTGWIDPRGRNA
jgi:hypothetical protein